jgi:tellurite resistance protein
LIIIFGLRVIFSTLSEGLFHCPHCGGDRQYRRRSGRRFFTLFFIPVIPLNRMGEFVECSVCHSRYDVGVLAVPTTAQLTAMPAVVLRAAICQVLRSGDVTHRGARERALAVVHNAGDQGYDEAALDQDLMRPFEEVRIELARASATLAPEERENFFAEAIRIALIDGPLTESERATVLAVGSDLNLTRVQVTGVIGQVEREDAR